MNGVELNLVQNERDISVTIDHQLNFESDMYEKNQENQQYDGAK